MRIIKDTKIDFMKQMRIGFILFGVIILLGLASLLLHGGSKLSIDFEGGTMVAVNFNKEMDVNDIRNSLSSVNVEGVNYDYSKQEIKHFGSPSSISVRLASQEDEHGNIAQAVIDHFYKAFPENVPEAVPLALTSEKLPLTLPEVSTVPLNVIFCCSDPSGSTCVPVPLKLEPD